MSNIKLEDVFGKAATAITTQFLENPAERITEVSAFRTKGMKTTNEEILAAVDGELSVEQAESSALSAPIWTASTSTKPTWNLLSFLGVIVLFSAHSYNDGAGPGIQSFAAISIISETGVNMFVFPISKHLCSWAGLTLQNNESAGKKKATRIGRTEAYIKPLLVQCTLCLIRKKRSLEICKRYENLICNDLCQETV